MTLPKTQPQERTRRIPVQSAQQQGGQQQSGQQAQLQQDQASTGQPMPPPANGSQQASGDGASQH